MSAPVLQIVPPKAVDDTVVVLEKALELAKSGEIIGIAYAAEMKDGAIQTSVPGTAGFNVHCEE